MNKAINIPSFFEYEHISSYCEKLLIANEFDTFNNFITYSGHKSGGTLYFYERLDQRQLYKFLGLDNWAEVYFKTAGYHFAAPLLAKEQRVKLLSQLFGLQLS